MPQFEPPIYWNDHEDIAQKLYEAGHITYMRTDCPTMSQQAHADVKQFISTTYGNNYYKIHKDIINLAKKKATRRKNEWLQKTLAPPTRDRRSPRRLIILLFVLHLQ